MADAGTCPLQIPRSHIRCHGACGDHRMTVIEIRPHRRGWKVFEAPGVEPVFLEKDQAMATRKPALDFVPERYALSIQPATLSA
jgi:hypothetical protein